MNGETGKPRRDANGKKMHRRITNGHYHHKIKTQWNMKKVSKRLGDLAIHDTALSMVSIKSSNPADIENHIFQCSYATSVMNINGTWQKGNAIMLKYIKMLQNWHKSMQLRKYIQSKSFLEHKIWQLLHYSKFEASTRIHTYYGGAHVSSNVKGSKNSAPVIKVKEIVGRFSSAVVIVDEYRTSQVCFDCNEQTYPVFANKKGIRGLLFCGSNECKSCRYKNRDENGAQNIYKVAVDDPPAFQRNTPWQRPIRGRHYLNKSAVAEIDDDSTMSDGVVHDDDDCPMCEVADDDAPCDAVVIEQIFDNDNGAKLTYDQRKSARRIKEKERMETLRIRAQDPHYLLVRSNATSSIPQDMPIANDTDITITTSALYNLGQTCFVNAIFTSIASLPLLMNAICDLTLTENSLPSQYRAVLKKMVTGARSGVRAIIPQYSLRHPFYINTQADAQEFMSHAFSGWEQESFSSLISYMTGKKTTCPSCGTETTTFDFEEDSKLLQLGIPSTENNVTLRDCFDAYHTHGQILNERLCNHCGVTSDLPFCSTIQTLPSVLVVQIKRFSDTATKCTKLVEFDFTISGNDFLLEDNTENYDLVAVVDHLGDTINQGHYISKLKSPHGWRKYNDSNITAIPDSAVCSKDAYILFYQERSQRVDYSNSVLTGRDVHHAHRGSLSKETKKTKNAKKSNQQFNADDDNKSKKKARRNE